MDTAEPLDVHTLASPYLRLVDAVAVTDTSGTIVACNEAFSSLLGFRGDELVGRRVWSLFSPVGQPQLGRELADTMAAAGRWSGYAALRRADGADRIIHLSVTPLQWDNRWAGSVLVLHDATALLGHMMGQPADLPLHPDSVQAQEIGVSVFARLVRAVARMAEIRDPDIEGHLERIEHVVRWLVGSHRSCCTWPAQEREGIAVLSLLHDVGKVALPEGILFKPAPLTPEERKLVERHTVLGEELIRRHLAIPGLEPWIARAAEIARWHHERWDGTGYPDGLAGEDIPMAARIVAVADVLDALLSRRAYKEPWPWSRAVAYIEQQRGRQFDPAVVDTFLRVAPAIQGFYASHGMPSPAGSQP